MKTLFLVSSLVFSLVAFSVENFKSFQEAKTQFESAKSYAKDYKDLVGFWTPNVLAVGTQQASMVLGHIDLDTNTDMYHHVLDGFKFYNQMRFYANGDVMFRMNDYLYNVFNSDKEVTVQDHNFSDAALVFSWQQKMSKGTLKALYNLDKNARKMYKAQVSKAIITQTCKTLSAKKMICQQTVTGKNKMKIGQFERYVGYDKL